MFAKLVLFFAVASGTLTSSAQTLERPQHQTDLSVGDTAMQVALQKEIYEILLADTKEVHAQYKEDGTFYTSADLPAYQKTMDFICREMNDSQCPQVIFTRRDAQGIAAMYPNKVLALHEKTASKLNEQEKMFILAHQ